MAFQKLNYEKLMALEPTVYETKVNQLGQEIVLVEHPLKGEDYPVIAIYHAEKIAVRTDFWDCDDFYENSEYMPVFKDGEIDCAFNFDL